MAHNFIVDPIFTMLIAFWLVAGFMTWLVYLIEFFNVRYLRPGLVEMVLLTIAGPIPLLIRIFKK